MNASIAPLQPAEINVLIALAHHIWHAHYPPIIGLAQTRYMLAQRYTPDVIQRELERNDLWWDTVSLDGEMIGFASSFVAEDPGAVKLDKLYIHPAQQRRGHGGLLLAHTCRRASRLGLERVVLAVNKHNSAAIAAYRKHGFDIVDTVVKEIGGGFVMDDYIMARALGPMDDASLQ